jgi:hypothetical protein
MVTGLFNVFFMGLWRLCYSAGLGRVAPPLIRFSLLKLSTPFFIKRLYSLEPRNAAVLD